jgi:hypothetical protein
MMPMTGEELMRVAGRPFTDLAGMLRKGRGILADDVAPRMRGTYSRADVLAILVYTELEAVFGTTSDRPAMMVRELRPRLQALVANGAVPDRLVIKSDLDGIELTVDVPGYQLLEAAQRRREEAMAGAR